MKSDDSSLQDKNSSLSRVINLLETSINQPKRSRAGPRTIAGLGVTHESGVVYLYFQSSTHRPYEFSIAKSRDGFDFELYRKNLVLRTVDNKKEDVRSVRDLHIVAQKGAEFSFIYKRGKNKNKQLCSGSCANHLQFTSEGPLNLLTQSGLVVPEYTHQNKHVMYYGEKDIFVAYSPDMKKWEVSAQPILKTRSDYFDSGPLETEFVMRTDKGIIVLYHSIIKQNGFNHYHVGAAVFDKNNPHALLWRSAQPLWEQSSAWSDQNVSPIGVVKLSGNIVSYWSVENTGIYAVVYSQYQLADGLKTTSVSLKMKKPPHNPILSPRAENPWEAFNTFNPAALYEGGKVHLVYRAQGYDYISVLGYAATTDPLTIQERLNEPIFRHYQRTESDSRYTLKNSAYLYMSGGGYGGCEDPRLTRINDRIYMTYVAFNGAASPRVALTSIALKDFLNKRWLWERPVLISPPGIVDKNAVIFPEKIKGKYVIMHRVYPNILIDFTDDLNFDGTRWLEGHYRISPRAAFWDSRKIGAGAPPLKTVDGWLLIYQAVGNQDPGRYKIGAMLLDLENPTKVLHRSSAPIIEPDQQYENEGFKAGVVYPCGAVVIGETLFVYYGGADSHVCVATANLDEFLAELKHSEFARLRETVIRRVLNA